MKKFENPMIEIDTLVISDVITTSSICADDCASYVDCPNLACPLD